MIAEGLRVRWLWFLPATLVLLAAIADPASAQSESTSADGESFLRPPASPTTVTIELLVEDILTIDERSGLVEIDAVLNASWFDGREKSDLCDDDTSSRVYIGESAREVLKSTIWHPDFYLVKGRGQREVSALSFVVQCDGSVTYKERFVATLTQRFGNLNDFPFDNHHIQITIELFGFGEADDVAFERPPRADESELDTDWESEEWHFRSNEQQAGQIPPSLTTIVEIDRKSQFYLVSIVAPLIGIVALSWTTFWMKPESLHERMAVSTTSLLTVVAFDFLTSDDLPKLEFTTRLDAFYNVSYLFVVSTVAVSLLALVGSRDPLPGWLDGKLGPLYANANSRSQKWFPLAYIGMVVLSLFGVFSPGAGGFQSYWPFDDGASVFVDPDAEVDDLGGLEGFEEFEDLEEFEDFKTTFGKTIEEVGFEQVDISAGFSLMGSIDDAGEFDLYRFCASEGEVVSVRMARTEPESQDLNPLLVLYDADDGSFVLFEDDSGDILNTRDSVITLDLPANGCYVMVASDLHREETGDYNIEGALGVLDQVSVLEQEFESLEATFGQSVGDLSPVEIDPSSDLALTASIRPADDSDAFRFCATEESVVKLRMDRIAPNQDVLDPLLVVYDEDGSLITLNDDAGQSLDSLVELEVSRGCYIVIALDLYRTGTGGYQLSGSLDPS